MKLQAILHEAANDSNRTILISKYTPLLNRMHIAADKGEYSFTFQAKDITYEFLEFLYKEGFTLYTNYHYIDWPIPFDLWKNIYNTDTEIKVEW